MPRKIRIAALVAVIICTLPLIAAQAPPAKPASAAPAPQPAAGNTATAEDVVRSLYSLVSVQPGGPPTDWDKVRALFYKDAVIFLRTAPQSTAMFSVQGFIDDFVDFDRRARVAERGYLEKIVRLKSMVFQDIAHVLVLYEASIPGSPRPPQQGIDSFQLVKKDGRWWILSVANDVPAPGSAIPKQLQE